MGVQPGTPISRGCGVSSSTRRCQRFSPDANSGTRTIFSAPVAQCIERIPPEDKAAGETPAGSTIPNAEWRNGDCRMGVTARATKPSLHSPFCTLHFERLRASAATGPPSYRGNRRCESDRRLQFEPSSDRASERTRLQNVLSQGALPWLDSILTSPEPGLSKSLQLRRGRLFSWESLSQ